MASDRFASGLRALVLCGTGAAAAASIGEGLYATAALAGLVALWTGAAAVVASRPVLLPPPPPPPAAGADERQRLASYLDLSPAPIVAQEGERMIAVNRAARRLFRTDDVVSAPPPALVEALAQTAPGRTATVTLADGDGDGMRPFALATGSLALGGRLSAVGVLIDIGAELRAAEAATLRELVQILSHEIVNALTPIASLAETAAAMLGDPAPDHAAVREAVETVARRAAGLQRFGDTYRTLARLPAPERRPLPVAGLVADLRQLFAVRWPALPLAIAADRAPPHVIADPDQLPAALWAILQNAAEAVEDRSDARVALSIDAVPEGTAFAIANNGPPIAAEQADAIFHPFMTTKPQGSGVGLALARQILRGHGGDVALARSDAVETRFLAVLR